MGKMRQGSNIDIEQLLHTPPFGMREGPEQAHARIIDQQIDRNACRAEFIMKALPRRLISQISRHDMGDNRKSAPQLLRQLFERLRAPSYENKGNSPHNRTPSRSTLQ